jgi:uncharacterized membrane protein YqiK
MAELKANAHIKQATGEAESTKLKAGAEAEGIRATGNAKAETYRAGVEALGEQGYTAMQLMQIIGDRQVRLIPDVLVSGNGGSNGLVDGLLTMLLWNQNRNGKPPSVVAAESKGETTAPPIDLPPVVPPELLANLQNRQVRPPNG